MSRTGLDKLKISTILKIIYPKVPKEENIVLLQFKVFFKGGNMITKISSVVLNEAQRSEESRTNVRFLAFARDPSRSLY